MHFDEVLSVFIHPCLKKRRRAQYSRGVDASVCVPRFICVCAPARESSHTARDCYCVLYARLVPSGSPYIES